MALLSGVPVFGSDGEFKGYRGTSTDISERKRAEEAMQLRNQALAGLIAGEALPRVLELIALSFEAEIPGWRCAIMLADSQGRSLSVGAAPSMPPGYHLAIDGLIIAPDSGSSGAAAALRQRVVIDLAGVRFIDSSGLGALLGATSFAVAALVEAEEDVVLVIAHRPGL